MFEFCGVFFVLSRNDAALFILPQVHIFAIDPFTTDFNFVQVIQVPQ